MMFKTVKAKIIIISLIMLAFLMAAFSCYTFIFRKKTKQLMLQNYIFSVESFVNQINEDVVKIEDNSRDLALIGEVYHNTGDDEQFVKSAITKIFDNYKSSLGGGIWFEPYIIDKNKKRLCIYIFRNKDNELEFDESFESEEYDYLNQDWYKQIISKVSKEHNIAWSAPYYENQGSKTMMITAGSGIYDGDKLIGISTVDWEISLISDSISKMKPIENRFKSSEKSKPIKNSFALFASKDYDSVIAVNDPYLDNNKFVGKSLKSIPWYKSNLHDITYINYHNKFYVPIVKNIKNGMMLILCIPKSEMFIEINKFMLNMLVVLLFIGILIPLILYLELKKYIVNPIEKLIDIAKKISKGEDVKIKIEKPEEFVQLASTFDKMTGDIKAITKDKEKINSELSIAKSIQASSLPNVFPPFPDNSEFDIYASMEPAKEIGGDFYDFYFIDNDNFMFIIADVSGKGVPAALFMMTVKTLINNMAVVGFSPKELVKVINKKICENNKQGFFVTMLAGIINVKDGKLSLINCGHNPPLIKRNNQDYEYINLESNIPLGMFENFEFKIHEMTLNENDILFTYTDGITEAENENQEMYGENRLKDYLNSIKNITDIKEIVLNMKKEIKQYSGNTLQSDDITILGFRFQASAAILNQTFKAKAEIANFTPFSEWLHDTISKWNLSDELINKIDVCTEEIFVNIAQYAYPEKTGMVEVSAVKNNDEIIIKFEDTGFAYNPLEKPDPDINLPPESRPIGGLGIYMVKEMAKKVLYERSVNKNILTMIF